MGNGREGWSADWLTGELRVMFPALYHSVYWWAVCNVSCTLPLCGHCKPSENTVGCVEGWYSLSCMWRMMIDGVTSMPCVLIVRNPKNHIPPWYMERFERSWTGQWSAPLWYFAGMASCFIIIIGQHTVRRCNMRHFFVEQRMVMEFGMWLCVCVCVVERTHTHTHTHTHTPVC